MGRIPRASVLGEHGFDQGDECPGLPALEGETLDGRAPPLTYQPGRPHHVGCWFTGLVKNGTPHLVNGGKVTCKRS